MEVKQTKMSEIQIETFETPWGGGKLTQSQFELNLTWRIEFSKVAKDVHEQ